MKQPLQNTFDKQGNDNMACSPESSSGKAMCP